MRRLPWVLVGLLALSLVLTNGWWFYVTIDQAVTDKYQEQMVWERGQALENALRALPPLAEGKSKEEVVRKLVVTLEEPDWFEKEGATVVGHLVLWFDDSGDLKRADTTFGMNQ